MSYDITEVIGHSAITPRVRHTGDCWAVSDACLVVDIVGTEHGRKFADVIRLLVGDLGRSQEHDGVRTIRITKLGQLGADFAHGVIPARSLPLTADLFGGVSQTVGCAVFVDHIRTFTAVSSTADGVVLSDFLAQPDSVFYFGNYAASD